MQSTPPKLRRRRARTTFDRDTLLATIADAVR